MENLSADVVQFCSTFVKFSFWKEDWALGYTYTQALDFLKISLFPKILGLKSHGNSWGISYIQFLVKIIRFTFGG